MGLKKYKLRWLPYRVRSFLYDNIYRRLFPAQRWLTKKIPRTFRDIDDLMETCVFACLVAYWEDDRGEETIRYQFQCEYDNYTQDVDKRIAEYKDVYDKMKAAYEWAKIREQEYEKLFIVDGYGFEYEQQLIETDSLHLSNIIKYRKYLWS